jgi:hypothetical protein
MIERQITINVFHDERLLKRAGWLYHGMLFVPSDQEDWLVSELIRLRAGYDGFLHFVDLRNPGARTREGLKTHVARQWARFVAHDTKHSRRVSLRNNFCAVVQGINLKNLNRDCFGKSADRNIFNRFFRMTLLSGIRHFYSSENLAVRIDRVFHATKHLPDNSPLRWHPMWKIQNEADGSIAFNEPQLTLITADHRREPTWPKQSQLVQLIDILLGGFSQCLDCTSTARGCTEVAHELQPIVQRLTENPKNKNSRYYKKYSMSFFPSQQLNMQELASMERQKNRFYTARRLKIVDLEQGLLDFDPAMTP